MKCKICSIWDLSLDSVLKSRLFTPVNRKTKEQHYFFFNLKVIKGENMQEAPGSFLLICWVTFTSLSFHFCIYRYKVEIIYCMSYEKHAWHIINTDEMTVNYYKGGLWHHFHVLPNPRRKSNTPVPLRNDQTPTKQEHHSATFVFTAGSVHPLMAQTVRNLPAVQKTWLGSVPRLGRSPGRGHGNPLQYSSLESPHGQRGLAGYRDGVAKSRTQLSNSAPNRIPSPTPSTFEPSDTSHLSPSCLWPTLGPASIPPYRYPHFSKVCFIALHFVQKIYIGTCFPNKKKSEEDFPFTKQGKKQK